MSAIDSLMRHNDKLSTISHKCEEKMSKVGVFLGKHLKFSFP